MFTPSIFQKYVGEIVTLRLDLTDTIPSGTTISTASAAAFDEGGNNVTSSLIHAQQYSNNILNVTIKDGSAGKYYIVWVTITFSDGQVSTIPLWIEVKTV